jgi:FixJ family two-component response regulator
MVDHIPQAIVAVVDDDPGVLESIESVLASAGYDVRVFKSAMALLASKDFAEIACLISDIGMPVINGYELQRIVHNIRPEMAVIFITGDPDWQIGEQSEIPHCGMFHKPFDCEGLLTAVENALLRPSHR